MKRSTSLAVALVVTAGLLAACSGSSGDKPSAATSRSAAAPSTAATSASDQAYNEALAAAEQKVGTAEEAARNQASPKTPESVITPLLIAWAAAEDSAADDLDGLTPPARAADANDHLVTALRDFADDLRAAVDSIKSTSKPWIKVLTTAMKGAKGPNELAAAANELNGLGYGTAAGPSPSPSG